MSYHVKRHPYFQASICLKDKNNFMDLCGIFLVRMLLINLFVELISVIWLEVSQ